MLDLGYMPVFYHGVFLVFFCELGASYFGPAIFLPLVLAFLPSMPPHPDEVRHLGSSSTMETDASELALDQ